MNLRGFFKGIDEDVEWRAACSLGDFGDNITRELKNTCNLRLYMERRGNSLKMSKQTYEFFKELLNAVNIKEHSYEDRSCYDIDIKKCKMLLNSVGEQLADDIVKNSIKE